MKSLLKALWSGAWGVLGMAGVAFTIRRLVEPEKPIGKTHYESVVELGYTLVDPSSPLPAARRIRLGEAAHLAFGAFWGLVFQTLSGRRTTRPWRDGAVFGIALWAAAFAGYMPALGISRPLWRMKAHEFFRTLAAHIVYGITTALALESFDRNDPPPKVSPGVGSRGSDRRAGHRRLRPL